MIYLCLKASLRALRLCVGTRNHLFGAQQASCAVVWLLTKADALLDAAAHVVDALALTEEPRQNRVQYMLEVGAVNCHRQLQVDPLLSEHALHNQQISLEQAFIVQKVLPNVLRIDQLNDRCVLLI